MAVKQIKVFVAGVELVIDTAGTEDAIEKAFFWQGVPSDCPVCGATVKFNHYVTKPPKSIKYWGLRCLGNAEGERHQVNFHLYKDGGGFYLQDNEPWKAWKPGENGDDQEIGENTGVKNTANIDAAAERVKVAEVLKATVKEEQKDGSTIWRVGQFVVALVVTDGNRAPSCDCRTFVEGYAKDKAFRCEHLLAVRGFLFDKKKAAEEAAAEAAAVQAI